MKSQINKYGSSGIFCLVAAAVLSLQSAGAAVSVKAAPHCVPPEANATRQFISNGPRRYRQSCERPLFVDLNNLDMRLQTGSPAIDSGYYRTARGVPAVGFRDFEKNDRIQDGMIDRGAYAYEHSRMP